MCYDTLSTIRDATIQFIQNRSDTENSEDWPISIQSDTSAVLFSKSMYNFFISVC